ncbi:serine/threonine-protein kinase [Streptomyces sp. NPDC050617]|uniref:serine/threonine-protein kinase n=1 Tax=Streptomyces sp. NPDC050617 TaxID=3154628 RepID=UPI00341FAE0C
MPLPLAHDDPDRFGAYRLIARLGSGGMGVVYLARSGGGRIVALKTMHARIASDDVCRTRFRLETDAARVMGGLHGAEVVDADPLADTPWLATEYVLGPPLDDAVALSGPLPEPSVRALGAALCGALGRLHLSDVVHRDLKPSNIMIAAYGPKVIDFGIARAIGDEHLTRTGAAAGTPAFMSPEQAAGGEHTPAGDVFALAGVLTFAATGRGPFGNGAPADLLYRVRYADPDLTGVPADLAAMLSRCLHKDPSRRPATRELAALLHDGSGEFADHLPVAVLAEIARRAAEVWQFWPHRLPVPATVPTEPEPAPSPARSAPARLSRRRLLAMGGGAALGLAAAGAGTWAWLGRGAASADSEPGSPWQGRLRVPLWETGVNGTSLELAPLAPFFAAGMVAVDQAGGLRAIDAGTGAVRWNSEDRQSTWETGTDGKRFYRFTRKHLGKDALALAPFSLEHGRTEAPVATFPGFNGFMLAQQLLCITDGIAYLAAGRGTSRLGMSSGAQKWFLLAVDTATGKQKWSQPLPAMLERPLRLRFLDARAVGGRLLLFQQTADDKVRVVARDARTGSLLWDKPLDGGEPDLVRGRLVADSSHVYVGTGRLRALRLSDGGEAWNFASGSPGQYYGPPSLKNGIVYATEKDRGVVAIDAGSGRLRWGEETGESVKAKLVGPPVVGAKYVYSRSDSGLRAIDLSSRRTAWTYKTSGSRFAAHERGKTIIGWGDSFLVAFPLV